MLFTLTTCIGILCQFYKDTLYLFIRVEDLSNVRFSEGGDLKEDIASVHEGKKTLAMPICDTIFLLELVH